LIEKLSEKMAQEEKIIEINKLTKIFNIPHEERRTLAESFIGAISKGKVKYEKLYALRDISLTVKKGDFLGIIGPNGSGKTTLLKVIAGILQPDKGSILVKGKVVSFLELGIGFVQELTAKENIYLYGSLLGLARKDIDEKLDAIISFAGIKKFIDTPLKDFSTGMMARLAFSIAKNVEADIYLIDEVLAVGDEEFQKKCIAVFDEFKLRGKTVLFVSHNTGLVSKICNRTAYLDKGKIAKLGETKKVITEYNKKIISKEQAQYLKQVNEMKAALKEKTQEIGLLQEKLITQSQHFNERLRKGNDLKKQRKWGTGDVEILKIDVLDSNNKTKQSFKTGETIKIRIHYYATKGLDKPEVGLAFFNKDYVLVGGPNSRVANASKDIKKGVGAVEMIILQNPFADGKYRISAAISKSPCKGKEDNYGYYGFGAGFIVKNQPEKKEVGLISLKGEWAYAEGIR